MTKQLFIGLLLFCCGSLLYGAAMPLEVVFSEDHERYISRFKDIAIREMERTGVPASIKLAQGILESDAGRSVLARSANNHFGIKCGSNWKGGEYYRRDDDYDENGRLIKSCFREYRNADASFVAHSEFLRDPAKAFRYGFLFRLNPTDYRAWAKGLRQAGYATNPRYPELLISLIERYNLQQYDAPGAVDPVEVEEPVTELLTGILRENDVSYFISEAPLSVEEVAQKVDLSIRRILDYNEALNQESQEVPSGERVYLQKKRKNYRGRERYYAVQEGEDLYDVAQRFGLRLDKLASRNKLTEEADPATGEKIKLRGGKVKDAPRLESAPDPNAPNPNNPEIPTTDDGLIDLDEPDVDTPPQDGPGVVRPRPLPPTRPIPTTPTPPNNEPTPPPVVNPGPDFGEPGTNPQPTPPVVTPGPDFGDPPTTPTPTPPVVTPRPDVGNPTPTPQPDAATLHTVQAGETLFAISRKYQLTVDQLKSMNNLTSNLISVGQRLRVK
ncbi:glucosaminidase domain-containing protein [Lewinella sp. W8]|uniref:glucosaminidase domain-containing protein n=1 Tax=Lewinella sp. W8 TaxID=2528208 RepID=UPI0010687082|nr:glucosaminidase domain-containing protein [Lewinella sp. W8]MTB52293.1 LysM peptidoglycan-binding domain-containing protein [Lewinella sp. W8]